MQAKRIFSIDLIRAIAIFLVILIHTSGGYVYAVGNGASYTWWIANLVDSFSRMSVPLFIIISGKLILENDEPIKVFLKKRFSRILFPFLFWGAIYIYANHFIFEKNPITLIDALYEIIHGPVYYHFWFVYMIIGLYLFAPFLRIWLQNSDRSQQFYFIGLWSFRFSIIQMLSGLLDDFYVYTYIFNNFGEFIGYFILGPVLWSIEVTKKHRWYLLVLFILGFIVTAMGTYIFSFRENSFNPSFYSYTSLNVLIMSISAFLLLKDIGKESNIHEKFIGKLIRIISDNSYAIFCIHVLFLQLIRGGYFNLPVNFFLKPFTNIFITGVIVFLLSLAVSFAMKKTKILKIFT